MQDERRDGEIRPQDEPENKIMSEQSGQPPLSEEMADAKTPETAGNGGGDDGSDDGTRIIPVEIRKEMRKSFIDYSMSVITARALPDVRDGLKPVHRRILYSMYKEGIMPDKAFRKSADLFAALSAGGGPGEFRLAGW